MTETAEAREGTERQRADLLPAREVDYRRAVRVGLVGALAASFVAANGMLEALDLRIIINPFLRLGYVVLFVVPLGIGYIAASPPPTIEGYEESQPGKRNVVAGLIAGALTGAGVAAFTIFISAVDLSSIFIKLTPRLEEMLTFGMGAGLASVLLMMGSMAALGTAGGALHLIERRWKRALMYALLWTFLIGLMQLIAGQTAVLQRMPGLTGVIYHPSGGLRPVTAAVIFVAVLLLYFLLDRPVRNTRLRYEALEQKEKRRFRRIALVVAIGALAVLPILAGPFVSEVLDLAGVFLLMALGLNIVVGYAGLLDLGYVAFFAVGAYTTAVLTSPTSPTWSPELIFWVAIPFILLAAAAAGLVVGTPVLRMRGDYLAIVTLGFGEIARIAFGSDALNPYFGGAQGITNIPDIPGLFITFKDSVTFFYPIFALAILFGYISYALQDSRIGRSWMAMREDEPVAEVMGINIVSAKLWAFVIGAMFAAIGGALFAHKIGSVFPESFAILISITVLVLIIVGGMGSVPGVAVGALVLIGLPELLREFQEFKFLLYGALLIFMMMKRPEGFIPSRRRAQELHEEELLQDAWLQTQEGREGDPDGAGQEAT